MVRVENVLHEPFKLTDEVKVIYWQMSLKKIFPFFELLIIYQLFKAYPRLATLCTESPFVFSSEEEKERLLLNRVKPLRSFAA